MLTLRRTLWAYSLPVAIAFAGVGLKMFLWYYSRPLWLDEEMVFLNIRDRTLSELARPLWLDQTAPLGWLALQRVALELFGTGDRAIRALSVLFGIGAAFVATWIGVRWMKPVGAALLVLFCGFGMWMTHYSLEAKPYAGDVFWALLLPALALWATEADPDRAAITLRRSLIWWLVATAGLWISYGAIFVAPACAVILCGLAWRRHGLRRAGGVALQGVVWLASFAVHYYFVMRHARASSFLVDYWSTGMPPAGSTLSGMLRWLVAQAEPIASHPGGTSLWMSFWAAAACGIAVTYRRRPALALLLVLTIASACLYAVIGLVPMHDRLALWILPAAYVSIALAADGAIEFGRHAIVGRAVPAALAAVAMAALLGPLTADIVKRGRNSLTLRPVENHGLNDPAGTRYLLVQHQPGDVLVANHFGLPALWWYGGISIAEPNAGRYYRGTTPLFELTYEAPGRTCRKIHGLTQPQRALAGARRAAVFLGFASRVPPGFQELALNAFSEFAQVVGFKLIANEGAVAIFDLQSPPEPGAVTSRATWRGDVPPSLQGCVNVRPARRW